MNFVFKRVIRTHLPTPIYCASHGWRAEDDMRQMQISLFLSEYILVLNRMYKNSNAHNHFVSMS